MAELVQGVKLKYELGSTLPKPVSFPFESIGDYRPVSQIPKYDFTLEKQIMKEIAKQKQTEQYNALKQAQQQLTMVDIIASQNAVTKPNSNPAVASAASQSAAGVSIAATSETAGNGVFDTKPGRSDSTAAASSGAAVSESSAIAPAAYAPAQAQQPVPAPAPSAQTAGAVYGPHKVNVQQQPQPQPQQLQLQASMQPAMRPMLQQQHMRPQMQSVHQIANNGHMGFIIPSSSAGQQQGRPVFSMPQSSPASTGSAGPAGVFPPFQRQQQHPMHQPAQTPTMAQPQQMGASPAHSAYASAQPGFSSSLPSWQSTPPQKETAASVQPVLPPKPEEWKIHPQGSGAKASSNANNAGASPSSLPTSAYGSSSAPALPARNQNQRWQQQQQQQQQGPSPPAIPPKPFMAFSEFDYASDEVSGMGSSSQTGHVEQLNTLLSMGFGRPQAIHALEMYDYDVNKASNYLIDKAFH
ncbi:hypothetical protein FB645_004861 [Coemansia sp. IMI 203386]|nr:hypothetical protein FB645_004861 [Coemansia sp. IMI 203386]